jgi:hypothetical protein
MMRRAFVFSTRPCVEAVSEYGETMMRHSRQAEFVESGGHMAVSMHTSHEHKQSVNVSDSAYFGGGGGGGGGGVGGGRGGGGRGGDGDGHESDSSMAPSDAPSAMSEARRAWASAVQLMDDEPDVE